MNYVRESIFMSALRAFCKGFFALVGIIIGVSILGGVVTAMFGGHGVTPHRVSITTARDAKFNNAMLSSDTPVILRINIHGIIGQSKLRAKDMEAMLLASRDGELKGDRVKGILLHFNTPGGTATDSAAMYQMLQEYKELFKVPVYGYVEGLCASGGMYIASACDKMYSGTSGIIGSVGVVLGPMLNLTGLIEKIGVSELSLTQGKNKDMLNPFKPYDEKKYQSIVNVMKYDYGVFVDVVSKARPKLTKEILVDEVGAQVYDPVKSVELGFIDEANSSYPKTLIALAEAAKIEGKYQVMQISPRPAIINDLLAEESALRTGKVRHTIDGFEPDLMNQILFMHE